MCADQPEYHADMMIQLCCKRVHHQNRISFMTKSFHHFSVVTQLVSTHSLVYLIPSGQNAFSTISIATDSTQTTRLEPEAQFVLCL